MKPDPTDGASTHATQRTWARLAGFLFLWLIAVDLSGLLTVGHIIGSGSFAESAQRVAASEHLYRLGLCGELIEALSVVLLGFALYVTLKPVNQLIAQVALYWKLGESAIGGAAMILAFVRLNIYLSATGGASTAQAESLMTLAREAGSAAYNISAIFFSIGSLLFFFLFFKSRYIPRALSALGVFASALVFLLCFGSLIFPEYAGKFSFGWIPMALAEVGTGFWLLCFNIRTSPQTARAL